MQTNFPYPIARSPLGVLDLTPTLQVIPSATQNLALNSSTAMLSPSLPQLSYLLLSDRLADLYEMVFPEHPEWQDEEIVDWVQVEDASAAVERFLERISTLFPVHDDFWDDDLEAVEWRLWEIPIITMGFDIWHDEWTDLKEPAPYLLHMCYSRRDEEQTDQMDEFKALYPQHLTPRYLEPHRLVSTLRKIELPPPLNALPDLIEMLNHSTGNAWLDVGEIALAEGGGYPSWERENVEWLAEEWQRAEPILDSIHRLLDWQNSSEEEIEYKLTAVRDVLLDAYQQSLACDVG